MIAVIVGLAAGVIAAIRRTRGSIIQAWWWRCCGICTPSFWLGLWPLMLVFAVWLGWFLEQRALIMGAPDPAGITPGRGIIACATRSSMLEVLNQDYIRTASARLSERRHDSGGPRHESTLIPVVTILDFSSAIFLREPSSQSPSSRSPAWAASR